MSSSASTGGPRFDGLSASELARRLELPRVDLFDEVTSTLDIAHRIAPQAPSGTLVIAESQSAGRGRHGRRWTSAAGAGLYITMIERPVDTQALDVLALRCGLYAAEALSPLADGHVLVKWPNDLYLDGGKLAGILIETRWRGTSPEWVAIGFGLNVRAPDLTDARGLSADVSRIEALDRLVPALRRASAARGFLTPAERNAWRDRDLAAGREVTEPSTGTVRGISPAGELLVDSGGVVTSHRSGSLIFAAPITCS